MIKRFFYLLKFIFNYIVKEELHFQTGKFQFLVDKEGNLFFVVNNFILQTEGYNLLSCDPVFVANLLSLYKRGEEDKIEHLIQKELDLHREETKPNLAVDEKVTGGKK